MFINKERSNVKKIAKLINKNRHLIDRIIVSEEFMLKLAENADLVDIDEKIIKMTSDYEFDKHTHKTEDEISQTYLFKVPCFISAHVIHGAVLEMKNGEYFVLKNI